MKTRIDSKQLEEAIYNRYLKPIVGKTQRYTGVEFEIPILNRKKEPVDFEVSKAMMTAFLEAFAFEPNKWDEEGAVIAADSKENGDDIAFECSFNTVEFSFGKETDLHRINERFRAYYSFIKEFLESFDHTVTGMGINPYRQINRKVPIGNGRYRMLFHYLNSYQDHAGRLDFHDYPDYGLFTASAQTHVDVNETNVVQAIRAFQRLEPLKALLFANSPLDDYLCARDFLWSKSMHGVNPYNVGGWNETIQTTEGIVSYIKKMSLYCLEREGKYINFEPTPLEDYYSSDKITGEYYDGAGYRPIEWEPELKDLEYLRSFKLVDLTFRGTLELRSTCMQPVSEVMSVPAFHLGLIENLDALDRLLDAHPLYAEGNSPAQLRELFCRKKLPETADKEALKALLYKVLAIAKSGLERRGLGEERFLAPLAGRIERFETPAGKTVRELACGTPIETLIEEFGRLDSSTS